MAILFLRLLTISNFKHMKPNSLTTSLAGILTVLVLASCEDVINIDLATGPAQVAVDGWITNNEGPQQIRVTLTNGYLNVKSPPPAAGAVVRVTDDEGTVFEFTDPKATGFYTWTPKNNERLGKIGRKYYLTVDYKGQSYLAFSEIKNVPKLDSITFEKDRRVSQPNAPEGYRAELWAVDLKGEGDNYWLRTFRNGKLLNATNNITVLYDAGFNANADTDGFMFIRPARRSINPDSLYNLNDDVKVEIRSIPIEAFYFFQELRLQVNNGGLFASPPNNVSTNVFNITELITQNGGGTNGLNIPALLRQNPRDFLPQLQTINGRSKQKAVGFFGAAATNTIAVKVTEKLVRPKQ